ncbi:hypothetical protein ACOTWR_06320 [Aliarcobacter butzleri]|uniref:hypothetical protein n=1 Tax=Aliarcobacter butzleri TaxID=28197 RepID=UPI0021B20245|nr:hypothetical protein [Aliarcobacter butzleri]MCT7563191.1 hypothetical protein [Aliarcobacter butzleri]MCT7578666.1 hypothetical protein [Aliarcobacter butzleri]MCT7647608.1 hypothetical protein [Aliarcobacter butzleri]
MSNFFELENISNDIVKIFNEKVKPIENKENFFERVLKKSEKIEESEKKKFILKSLLKRMFNYKTEIENELYKKDFLEFSKRYLITREEFEDLLDDAKRENEKVYFESPEIKKIVQEVKSELPNISSRVYNINLGLFTKANGEELTLKEYSLLTGEDYKTLKRILLNAQKLIAKKIERRLSR